MKRITIYFILFIVILPVFSNGTIEFNYEIGDFDKILETTNDLVNDFKDVSEDYIVTNTRIINSNLAIIRKQLSNDKNFWGNVKSDSKKLEEYLSGLKKMVSFYDDICKNETKVKERLTSDINKLYALSFNMENILYNEKKQLLTLTRERSTYDQTNSKMDYSLEINSLDQQISYCKMRIDMIERFYEKYSSIEPELNKIYKAVDVFCNTIKESLKVFQAAYNTVKLSKDIYNSFLIQYDMSELDNLSENIQKSWIDLDFIVSDLASSLEI